MSGMRSRPSFLASLYVTATLVVASAAVEACTTDYQLGKGDVSYGDPNGLHDQRPPASTTDIQAEGGATSAAPGSTPDCVTAGGALVEAGTCAVSFSKDILAAFGVAGCSAATCHGGVTPFNEPRIDPGDPGAMWTELQAYSLSNNVKYINPCSIDPTASSIGCNLSATGAASACGTHMPQGADLPADAVTKIATWQACGSPNN
jgi:hypothetical protein